MVTKRLTAHAAGRGLDRLLEDILGWELAEFMRSDGDREVALPQRPLLIVFYMPDVITMHDFGLIDSLGAFMSHGCRPVGAANMDLATTPLPLPL